MSLPQLLLLLVVVFLTSVVGVVTGSNSLITVPVMFELGIDEKTAVATNMFGLTFLAIGGAIPFLRRGTISVRRLSPLIALTLAGSAIGAAIVGVVSNQSIKAVVTAAMIAVVVFTILKREKGSTIKFDETHITENASADLSPSNRASFKMVMGYVIVFLLAIYGGLYSGGYVTVLTVALVAFFGITFAGSIAATKVINAFSSAIATAVFLYQGLVDLRLGVSLAAVMFVGAYIGAHFASKMNEVWLRRIFLSAVILLALKLLLDFLMLH